MKLTVLGKYGPYPRAGGACSSYLVESNDAVILLDMGNGSLARLLQYRDLRSIDAVVLTHMHSDHISDVFVLRYALQIKKREPLPLFLPESPANMFELLRGESVFSHTLIKPELKIQIKDIVIEFSHMAHPVESYAVKLHADGKALIYSGDTSKGDRLASFARSADLLVCDAAFSEETVPKNPPHLTAKQAAYTAAEAGVRSLLLSHINPDQDESILLLQAKEAFIPSMIAEEGKTYIL